LKSKYDILLSSPQFIIRVDYVIKTWFYLELSFSELFEGFAHSMKLALTPLVTVDDFSVLSLLPLLKVISMISPPIKLIFYLFI